MSKAIFEITHKTSYPNIESCALHTVVKACFLHSRAPMTLDKKVSLNIVKLYFNIDNNREILCEK